MKQQDLEPKHCNPAVEAFKSQYMVDLETYRDG
jgi:hypothetical protein